MPAGVRGRRSQEKLAEKARGDIARNDRKDGKDALQNLEKVEKTHLSWLGGIHKVRTHRGGGGEVSQKRTQ